MMQRHTVEALWKVAEPQGRRSEMARIEVFLDFDPVFPGWPPEALADEQRPGTRAPAREHHTVIGDSRRPPHDDCDGQALRHARWWTRSARPDVSPHSAVEGQSAAKFGDPVA